MKGSMAAHPAPRATPTATMTYATTEVSSTLTFRKVSEQSLIQTPKRRCLTHARVSDLMIIKCNLKFIRRQGNENELLDYLFKKNPLHDHIK